MFVPCVFPTHSGSDTGGKTGNKKGLCVCVCLCLHTEEELNGFVRTQISKFSVKIRFRFSVELCLEYN